MPGKHARVKNEKQYEALKDEGMSKDSAAKIAYSPGASRRGGRSRGPAAIRARVELPRRRRRPVAKAAPRRRASARSRNGSRAAVTGIVAAAGRGAAWLAR